MPHNIDWRHFIAFGGVLVSITLPYLLFQPDEYEYVEVVDELDEPEDDASDPETEKESADDQQDD